jgi:hypothetical protein
MNIFKMRCLLTPFSKMFCESFVKTKKIFKNKGIISKHIERSVNKVIDEDDVRGYLKEIVRI